MRPVDPPDHQLYYIILLLGRQLHAARNAMPFQKTATAACGRSMLSREDRMAAVGCLLAIIVRRGRSEPAEYEIARVRDDDVPATLLDVLAITRREFETRAELGSGQLVEDSRYAHWSAHESSTCQRLASCCRMYTRRNKRR